MSSKDQSSKDQSMENNNLTENTSQEVLCPSCGKFVGAYERCPYCQADLENRFHLKIARRVAVFGSIIGLILLYFASINKKVETISVAAIEANHNMALVKLNGKVADIRINSAKNGLNITLDDGTGRIKLSGFDKLDRFERHFSNPDKSDGKGLPAPGDEIEVKGNLNITDKWGAGIFLTSPERLTILKRAQIEKRDIQSFTDEDLNNVFMIQARVKSCKELKALKSIILTDQNADIPLTVFNSEFDSIADPKAQKALLIPGSELALQVILSEYQGNHQLRLNNPEKDSAIKVISMGKYKQDLKNLFIKDLNKGLINKRFIFTGKVAGQKRLKGLRIIDMAQDDKNIDLVVYDDIFDAIPQESMRQAITKMDNQITVTVKVTDYKDKLQLALVKSTPVITALTGMDALISSPAEVNPARQGETMTILGRIASISHTTAGTAVIIQAKGAAASVWLTKDLVKPIQTKPGLLVKDALVKVTGKVALFRGRAQIQPVKVNDFRLGSE
jgi:DNA/RNA endonuclease YhcR with UshA esterase domain